jgi:hypothetical protein
LEILSVFSKDSISFCTIIISKVVQKDVESFECNGVLTIILYEGRMESQHNSSVP